MDALSSQATVAGYKAVLLAAANLAADGLAGRRIGVIRSYWGAGDHAKVEAVFTQAIEAVAAAGGNGPRLTGPLPFPPCAVSMTVAAQCSSTGAPTWKMTLDTQTESLESRQMSEHAIAYPFPTPLVTISPNPSEPV